METNIHAVKIGKTINIWLNGQLKKKICDTNEKADKLFKLLLDEKSNPTKDSVNKILSFLNEKTRIAMECGLENDPQTGEVYMAGFSTPVPETLIDVIKEYHEKGFPLKAVVNFWMMLMLNLDKRIRNDLFDFINQHDFVLTDNGYLIVYKAVDIRTTNIIDDDLSYFINKSYNKVKKTWTTNPKRYIVYLDLNDDTYRLTKTSTADKWDLEEKEIEILGNLNDLYLKLETKLNDDIVEFPYTDKYTGKFKIKLGEPVKMLRNECNGDPRVDCSYGLHVGATKYVEHFGSWFSDINKTKILACYVNPANVVAVPLRDHSKIRVSEYFPFAEVNYDKEKKSIEIFEQKYFESDYCQYEKDELEAMAKKIKNEEPPMKKAMNCDDEERPLEELKKIIENRLVDISK